MIRKILISIPILAILSVTTGTSSSALSNTISSPFEIGSTWYICQGYNGPVTHTGSFALDLTASPNCDQNSAHGQNIKAPLSGTVAWYSSFAGSLCINTDDSRSIGLYHIESSLKTSDRVVRGQTVGTIGAPHSVANAGLPHLHLEMWSSAGCSDINTRIPFDVTNNSKICGANSMSIDGPDYYNNGTWSGTSFMTSYCMKIPKGSDSTVYRFWSDSNQRHFYTANYDEAQYVADFMPDVWKYEGLAYTADPSCSGPQVFRFWSDKFNGHFYTASAEERDRVITDLGDTWKYEGIAYCALPNTGNDPDIKPVYRFWSNSKRGHFYTSSEDEKQTVIDRLSVDWKYEGIAFFVK